MKPYENLKMIRNLKNLTTYDLAELTKIPQSAISKMENNKRKLDADSLQKLSTALGVPVSDFFKDDSVSCVKEESAEYLSIKEQVQLDKEASNIVNNLAVSLSKDSTNLSESDYFAIETAIRSTLEVIKLKNKDKYTNNKYKKEK